MIEYGEPLTNSPAVRVKEARVVATLPVSLILAVPFQVLILGLLMIQLSVTLIQLSVGSFAP